MRFKPFKIERLVSGETQIKVEGKQLTVTIIPPEKFIDEAERLSAIVFNELPYGTELRLIRVVLKGFVPTGSTGRCQLLFKIFVREKHKGYFTSPSVSTALYEALIIES